MFKILLFINNNWKLQQIIGKINEENKEKEKRRKKRLLFFYLMSIICCLIILVIVLCTALALGLPKSTQVTTITTYSILFGTTDISLRTNQLGIIYLPQSKRSIQNGPCNDLSNTNLTIFENSIFTYLKDLNVIGNYISDPKIQYTCK